MSSWILSNRFCPSTAVVVVVVAVVDHAAEQSVKDGIGSLVGTISLVLFVLL